MKEDGRLYKLGKYIIPFLLSGAVAAGVALLALYFDFYRHGSEVYGELYKLDIVKKALDAGDMYPLYVEKWYNGYEMFRYTSPIPYVLICLITYIPGVGVEMGISVFYGIVTFLSMMGFFLFGIRQKKLTASFFIGLAFLLLPTTLYAAVSLCRLDVLMGLALMPGVLFWIFEFLECERRRALFPLTCSMILMVASHYVLSIVFGLVMLLYLFLHMLSRKTWKFEVALAGNLFLAYITMGYFLYAAVSGGMLERGYASVGRWSLVIGYVLLVACAIGLFLSDRTRIAGFLVAILGIIISYGMFGNVLKLIPFVALQDSYWYLAVAMVLLLVMLLYWKRLRTIMIIIFAVSVVIETFPLLNSVKEEITEPKANTVIQDYLIDEAVAITNSRLALMDNKKLGVMPHWYIALQGVNSVFGGDSANALTTRNLASLNEAFADGFYDYMFDRLLLYGNDVIIILKENLTETGSYQVLLQAAENNNYSVHKENDKAIVLKLNQVSAPYGVVTKYDNLAIGETSNLIAYIYPSFGMGDRDCLEDYKIEELVEYDRLYLSGFTYRNKERAENMLRELSSRGVKIYIDMQHIPINELTGKNEFMGAYAQFIQFTEDFPILENDGGNQFKLDFQTVTDTTWNTVYVSGCDNVFKEAIYEGRKHLAYLTGDRSSDVKFMGFNLVYYYLSTHNVELKRFLDEAMDFSGEVYTKSEIVPITIEYLPEQIKVTTDTNDVNCNLAIVETLVPNRILETQEDMWLVNQGDTVFKIVRPNNTEGIFFSVFGLIGIALLWIFVYVVLEPVNDKSKQEIYN